ncbi:hypothetical protein Bca101_059361 [Brassica carinata]
MRTVTAKKGSYSSSSPLVSVREECLSRPPCNNNLELFSMEDKSRPLVLAPCTRTTSFSIQKIKFN